MCKNVPSGFVATLLSRPWRPTWKDPADIHGSLKRFFGRKFCSIASRSGDYLSCVQVC